MIQLLPDEIVALKYHRLVVNYGEDFIKEKGLKEEFLRYAQEKEKEKEVDRDGFCTV